MAVLAGMLGWGTVGLYRSLTEDTYPWNVWVPFDEGITKGAVIGLFAGVVAVLGRRLGPRGPRALGAYAFAGAVFPGTVAALLGAPQPALYFLEPMPDAQWYGTTMVAYWAVRTLAPALGCALVVAALAWLTRPGNGPSRVTSGALIAASFALLRIAYLPIPELPQGSGEHVNEGAIAILGILTVATACFWSGVVRLLLAWRRDRRAARAARPDLVLAGPPPR